MSSSLIPHLPPPSQHASADVEKMILGNKCDVNDKRQVSKERGEKVGMVAQGAEGLGVLGFLCRGLPRCLPLSLSAPGAWDKLVTPVGHVPWDGRSTHPARASWVRSAGSSSKPTMVPLQAFKTTGVGNGAMV